MNESSVKHIHQPSSSQDKNLSEEPNIEPSPHQNELENFLEISKEPMDAVRTIKLDRHLPIIKSQKSNKSISFIM